MAYVRGIAALIEETVRTYLTSNLQTLGWMTTPYPYGAELATTVTDYAPNMDKLITPNMVALTNGDEEDDEPEELGATTGGLFSTKRPFFADVYGENQGIALRLADDVKGILTGKFTGTKRYQLINAPSGGTIVDHLIHFDDVKRLKLEHQDPHRNWHVVKFTVTHEFNASENGA